ncbi:MAG: hypothetical protein KAJ19_30040 [Gammaproteobacteria bacterium]|nr:hypothetical protein [Gammaproteobacteria bacterium]
MKFKLVITISTRLLVEILKQLNDNGFQASIFALKDGLPLASSSKKLDEKMVSAMSAMLLETVERVKDTLNLSEMVNIKIVFEDSCILIRNIIINNEKSYILAGFTDKPATDEVDKYNEQLLDWAEENGRPILEKLSSL